MDADFSEGSDCRPTLARLICKWLQAGAIEYGYRVTVTKGALKVAVILTQLADIYLDYVLNLWARQWCERRVGGDVIVRRYAGCIVVY